MNTPQKIGIYCASSTKVRPEFFAAAHRLGQLFAEQHIALVFGAGNMGLMGAIADAVVENGGEMIGVIPDFMIEQDWHHKQCTQLIVTNGMSDRKQTIERISDAFVAMPGGIGTMDELFECMVNKQLGLHAKPIVILNVGGYYDTLIAFLKQMVEEHMLRDLHTTMFTVVNTPDEVIPAILNAPAWDTNARKHAKI